MADLYPEIEPYEHGLLEVGESNLVYWETCGNPSGKPAVVVHGGPGSGCTPYFRRFFNPRDYRVVLFDHRNCGRSLPNAGDPATDLAANTTHHLIGDMELLRRRLGIERWLVLGGSWGSTLSLAYAETYPQRVTEMILFGVTTGRHSEIDWAFRGGLARFFPQQWDRLVEAVPAAYRGGDIVDAYHRWLSDPDPEARRRAAEEWCTWESATPDWPPKTGLAQRFKDPGFALAFSRIVTHYIRHNVWLKDGVLLENVGALSEIPGCLVNGRFDFQAPISNAWGLKRVWPRAEMVIVDDAGHGTPEIGRALVRATDRFASAGSR
jgi:proline iminopeptidase